MNKTFYIWWINLCLILTGSFWLQYSYNAFGNLYDADVTKISFLILTGFIIVFLYLGYLSYKYTNEYIDDKLNLGWFFSDQFMTLGMIGTVVGLIYMFSGLDFSSINLANVDENVKLLLTASSGVGIALYTTGVGLICSFLTKFQLFIMEHIRNNET